MYTTQSHPVLHFYQIHQNIVKGIRVTEQDEINFDSAKSKKGRFVILLVLSHSTFLPKTIKIFLRVFELQGRTRNLFQTKQREITPNVRKPKMSFLFATGRLVLF